MTISDHLIDALVDQYRQRFMNRVVVTNDEHWQWTGRLDSNDVPLFNLCGRTKSAKLVSYWLHCGDVPSPLKLYKGENCLQTCVNPKHFVLARVTPSQQKLNASKVKLIRGSDSTDEQLALLLDVSVNTVRDVRHYRTWRDVK